MINPHHWLFLFLLGILTAIYAYLIDLCVAYTIRFKHVIIEQYGFNWTSSLVIWVILALFFTAIAASIGEFISKDAEGSGIPELKSILAGVSIYRYLSVRTLIGKIIGLYAALAGGLSVGKEGPFVHISAGIVNKLSKLSYFRDILKNKSLK